MNGTVQRLSTQLHDTGVEGGRWIIRNHLFFSGAIDPQWETRTMQVPQRFPLFSTGGYDRKCRNVSYSAKGTTQFGGKHRIDASLVGDRCFSASASAFIPVSLSCSTRVRKSIE